MTSSKSATTGEIRKLVEDLKAVGYVNAPTEFRFNEIVTAISKTFLEISDICANDPDGMRKAIDLAMGVQPQADKKEEQIRELRGDDVLRAGDEVKIGNCWIHMDARNGNVGQRVGDLSMQYRGARMSL